MCNYTQSIKDNKNVIDVVEDFNYDTQTDVYNKAYKKWRVNKNNPYVFHYVKDKREKTFVDGKGFVNNTPQTAEKRALSKISYASGFVLLIYFFIDNIGSEIVVWFLNLLKVNIDKIILSTEFMGNEWAVLGVELFIMIIKYVIPISILKTSFQLPFSVALPIKIADRVELLGGISISLLLMIVISLIFPNNSTELFTSRIILDYENNTSPAVLFLYYIFAIIIGTILAEVLLHGVILQALRQFGDIFAVLATTALSLMLEQNFKECVAYAFLTLLSGIFILRSGSIITGIIIRGVFNSYFFALMLIDNGETDHSIVFKAYFMSCMFFIAILGCAVFINKYSHTVKLVNNSTFLNFAEKSIAFIVTFPMIVWITLSITFASMKYFI